MALPRAAARVFLGGAGCLGTVTAYRYNRVVQRERQLPTDERVDVFPQSLHEKKKGSGDDEKNNGVGGSNEHQQRRRVIVIGGGVVGTTTAYKLARAEHAVTVVESRSRPGQECSACAAGGMQRSNPVVDRASWVAVMRCIAPRTASLIFGGGGGGGGGLEEEDFKFFNISWKDTLSDPFFLRWVLTFTKTSLFPCSDQERRQQSMLEFTRYAVEDMVKMMEDESDVMSRKSGYNPRGGLSLSYDPIVVPEKKEEEVTTKAPTTRAKSPATTVAATSSAKGGVTAATAATANPTQSKMDYEPYRQLVGSEEIFRVEPSLKFQARPPTGAKFQYEARAASSERFTLELASRCENDPDLDVTFLYDTSIGGITVKKEEEKDRSRVTELKTNRGVIHVDDDVKVVVAAGSWTPRLLSLMDLYVPVYPLKGYAMSVSARKAVERSGTSLPANDDGGTPSPVLKYTDELPSRIVSDKYMFTSRLGDEIRITSIGEFAGWSTAPTPHVDEEFRREASRQLPQIPRSLVDAAPTRCGHRPYVSDGILLLGAVDTHDDLYVSCGPGSNGWKLAMGSGDVIEKLVSGRTEEEVTEDLGFDVKAFSPDGRVLNAPIFAKLCRARWDI